MFLTSFPFFARPARNASVLQPSDPRIRRQFQDIQFPFHRLECRLADDVLRPEIPQGLPLLADDTPLQLRRRGIRGGRPG